MAGDEFFFDGQCAHGHPIRMSLADIRSGRALVDTCDKAAHERRVVALLNPRTLSLRERWRARKDAADGLARLERKLRDC